MGRFTADPATLDQEGGKINTLSENFEEKINNVYSSIDNMITNDYISPEAKVIAERIKEKKKDLEEMQKTIKQYGDFSKSAAKDVVENQEEISSEIAL